MLKFKRRNFNIFEKNEGYVHSIITYQAIIASGLNAAENLQDHLIAAAQSSIVSDGVLQNEQK